MKCIVIETFIDKYTGEVYSVGDTIDFDDAERISDLSERMLVKVCEEAGEKPPKRTKKAKS